MTAPMMAPTTPTRITRPMTAAVPKTPTIPPITPNQ